MSQPPVMSVLHFTVSFSGLVPFVFHRNFWDPHRMEPFSHYVAPWVGGLQPFEVSVFVP